MLEELIAAEVGKPIIHGFALLPIVVVTIAVDGIPVVRCFVVAGVNTAAPAVLAALLVAVAVVDLRDRAAVVKAVLNVTTSGSAPHAIRAFVPSGHLLGPGQSILRKRKLPTNTPAKRPSRSPKNPTDRAAHNT